MMSDLNMFHEKMSDFVSFLLFVFTSDVWLCCIWIKLQCPSKNLTIRQRIMQNKMEVGIQFWAANLVLSPNYD